MLGDISCITSVNPRVNKDMMMMMMMMMMNPQATFCLLDRCYTYRETHAMYIVCHLTGNKISQQP